MTHHALVLELCQRMGHLDPAAFYRLPSDLQRDHLAHLANNIEGWYTGNRPRHPGAR